MAQKGGRGSDGAIRIALFRWGDEPDIPDGARAFSYHQQIMPMGVALLCLSLVELTVVHLLVSHWSRTAALVMSLISGVALVTLVGLIKSFRLRPILLEADGLRLRGGVLFDRLIPFSALAHVETEVAPDSVRAPTTWNTAFLSWPNVMLSLCAPLPREGFKRRRPAFHVIALRVDDPEPFIRQLRAELAAYPAAELSAAHTP